MLRQVDQPNEDELVFSIGGMQVTFGRVKFSLISRLDCPRSVHKLTATNENRLWKKYFPGERSMLG